MAPRYRRPAGVVHRDFGDVVLVLPAGAPGPVELRGGATYVWAATEEPATVDEIAALVGVEAELVSGAVDDLVANGVLEAGT